jgi:DNA-binding GntR family transcriptional regulator
MRLKETELAQELAVSRTPIREALSQLSKEGLVEIIPRRGAFVKRWTKQEALEVLVLREALEGLAGKLASARITNEEIDVLETLTAEYEIGSLEYAEADKRFHEGIVNACGMERLKELIWNLYDSLQMRKILAFSFHDKERIRESVEEHRRIIQALRERDEDAVERAIKDNFRKTRSVVERI